MHRFFVHFIVVALPNIDIVFSKIDISLIDIHFGRLAIVEYVFWSFIKW